MSLQLGPEPFQKFGVGGGWWVVVVVGGGGGGWWWWWSKDILEFRFGPNLGSWDQAEQYLDSQRLGSMMFITTP